MKGLIVLVIILFSFGLMANPISKDCKFNGKKLSGRVRIVQAFGDVKVRVVTAFPNLKVVTLTYSSDRCGEWTFVQGSEDFTIQFVEAFEDVKIEFVQAFSGINE